MWSCPVCDEENKEGLVCNGCGFDETKNYVRYRLPGRLSQAACREYKNVLIKKESYFKKGVESFKNRDYTTARCFFENLAEKGDALSQYWLGCSLLESIEKANQEAGMKWLEKAALQGLTCAQVNLGYYYYRKISTAEAAKKATDWFWEAAKKGDGVGALWLGISYYLGRGSIKNYQTAFTWFQKAEKMWKAGDEWAVYFWLGICCYYGHGTEKNYEQALEYLTKGRVYPGYLEEYMYKNGEPAFFNLVAYYLGRCFYEGTGVKQNDRKAFLHFRKAADDFKIPDVWYWLGLCYLNGAGTEKNISTAESCFKIAAEGESEYNTVKYAKRWQKESYFYIEEELPREYRHEAELRWAECLWQKGKKEEAKNLYQKAASGGCEEAKRRLNILFAREKEPAQNGCNSWDDKRSEGADSKINEYISAANQGDAEAQYNLGCCYYYGCGVSQDYKQAVKWYEKSANQGYSRAQNNLGVCYKNGYGVPRDYGTAVSWYEKSANQGHMIAQNNLGSCYESGCGVPKDYGKAVSWYEKSAKQGFVKAQCNLGCCYYYGYGVPQDYKKANIWYEKAAAQGDAEAQYNVGCCYYYGRGVPKDYKQAAAWYEKSADQGYARAQNNLGVCYKNGYGVPKDDAKAVIWYERAASQGHATAQNNLGNCYEIGYGVQRNEKKAAEWYEKAAEQGYMDAKKALERMRGKGT